VRNKPNYRPAARLGAIMRQRLVARCRSGNKANLGRRAAGGQVVQTKPIPRSGQTRGRLCKTNPIPGSPTGARGTNRAKQSQSPAEMPTIPLFYHSTIPVRCLSCKTKPTWLGGAGAPTGGRCETNPILEPRPAGRRGQLYRQTQFPPLCRSGDRHSQGADCAERTQSAERRPVGRGQRAKERRGRVPRRRSQPCETKPIYFGVRKTIVKAKGLGDATRRWGDGAKRSQFPAGRTVTARFPPSTPAPPASALPWACCTNKANSRQTQRDGS
jgi:hypothetical protein